MSSSREPALAAESSSSGESLADPPRSASSIPTAQLTGAAEATYVRLATACLQSARLNTFYPTSRPLASHLASMGPEVHGGLYGGLEIDLRSGLPTYKEWVRVKTDQEVAPGVLAKSHTREALLARARARPDTIYGKQLLKHDYYRVLANTQLASLSHMEVALRRVEPENRRAFFHVRFDKLDVAGTFTRYTIDLAQQASVWNRPMVTLDDDTAGHTEAFRTMIYRYASLDAELTFAKLVTLGHLEVEKVVKGTVGPFYLSGMDAPVGIKTLLDSEDGFVASFGLQMAAVDLERDGDNDPITTLLEAKLSEEARREYGELRERRGYRVFKDRKFVVPRRLMAPLRAYCEASGTRNVIYPARGIH